MIRRLTLEPVLKRLQQSGFYYGSITAIQAKTLLQDQAVGKFLVRDSSDMRHLFTITLVTTNGVTNIRIIFCKSFFSLDKNDAFTRQPISNDSEKDQATPKFDCVVKLVFYYMLSSRMLFEKNSIATGHTLLLLSPLYKEVSSLQHLCRRTLHSQILTAKHESTAISNQLRCYLTAYPYPV